MKRVVCLTVWMLLAAAARADVNEGITYFAHGDFDKAAQTFMPLAQNANNPIAQRFLGQMYAEGKGVTQDYTQAAKWYRSAAEQGLAAAQYQLGILYRDGKGLPQDMEQAYAWFTVAGNQGHQLAQGAVGSVEAKLSADEMTEARKLAEELIVKYGKAPDLNKAEGVDEPVKLPDAPPALP